MNNPGFFDAAKGTKINFDDGGNNYKKRKFEEILIRHQWSDCEFIVGKDHFPAHKIVMACNSPVFEAVFFGPMATSEPIIIEDSKSQYFKKFLEYCYTEHTTITSVEEAWNLVYLARKYLVDGLESHCDKFISKHLNISLLLYTYEQSKFFEKKDIEELCEKEICTIIKVVFLYTTYHPLPETLYYFLRLENIPDDAKVHLFLGAVNWASTECELNDQESSVSNVWKILETNGMSKILKTFNLEDIEISLFDSTGFYEKHYEFLTFAKEVCDKYLISESTNEDCACVPHSGTYQASQKAVVYRTPPHKIRERVPIWRATNTTHKLTVDSDCYLTGVIISCFCSHLITNGNILVTFTEKGNDKKIKKWVSSKTDSYLMDKQVKINFSDIIILRKDKHYYLNVEYFNGQGREIAAYNFLPFLNAKSVCFTIADNAFSVLTGLCFYPL